MSSRRTRLLVTLVLIVSALPLLTAAGNGDDARAEHQRIIEFWTPERVAQAVPRHFVLDPGTGHFSPSKGKPPGTPGGGGGGGDSSVVTGASWKQGGEIDGASGKVLFAMGGSHYVCSAAVIVDTNTTRSLILTAAHCVYDESNGQFATNWMFIPDYDDQPAPLTTSGSFCEDTTYGCWTASEMAVHSGYTTAGGFNADAVQYDFAVVAVGGGGHSTTAQLDATVNAQQYSFSAVPTDGTTTGHAFGYPAQKRWKGNDLIYCAGPIDTDPLNNDDTYRLNECKLNGGSSGGPWLAPFTESSGSGTVTSVNSYGYNGINAMHGPILNGHTQAVYDAALDADAGINTVTSG